MLGMLGAGVPAHAALLHLTCFMNADRTDAIHPLHYTYYVNVDEDARHASDQTAAYYLWPEVSGLGYTWYGAFPVTGQVAWETRYVFERDTGQLWVEDVSADGSQSGASQGVCQGA